MAEPAPIGPLEWTDDLVASLWEYYSTCKPELYFTAQFGDRILDETARFVPAGSRVCDFGCGPGHLLRRLVTRYATAGVDFSAASLRVAAERVGQHENLLGLHQVDDAAAAEAFDVVYFVETIEHVLPHHMANTFDLLRRLLKPGGAIVCTTPNEEDLSLEQSFCPVTRKVFHRYQHVWSFSADSLAALFREHGFAVETTFTTNFAARRAVDRLKARIKHRLGRHNPHLVLVARPVAG